MPCFVACGSVFCSVKGHVEKVEMDVGINDYLV